MSPFGVANTFNRRMFFSFTPCSRRTAIAVNTVAPESVENKIDIQDGKGAWREALSDF